MTVQEVTFAAALRWLSEGRRVATAVLVEVLGSAPLNPGAAMLIDEAGNIEGSVTGGCVEGALVEEAQRIFAGGEPRVATYGISDELAGEVGLMCGGTVRILVSELTGDVAPAVTAALRAAGEGRPAAIATLLDGPGIGRRLSIVDEEVVGELGVTDLLDRSVARDAAGLLEHGVSMIRRYGADGSTMGDDLRVFVRSFASPPRMVIFGAIDFSAALAVLARESGYQVTICDARESFLDSERFSRAAEVVNEWPDRYLAGQTLTERDAVLVFTHDSKFDEPALKAALDSDAGYIGALGSRRTQEDRRRRLADAGVPEAQLERIVGPCGLDIGAATPMETAISILAEIVARRAHRSAAPLTETGGAIRARAESHVP
jgi:xanthine dehydrogenase accessory factor